MKLDEFCHFSMEAIVKGNASPSKTFSGKKSLLGTFTYSGSGTIVLLTEAARPNDMHEWVNAFE
jgi:hypothetical protein